MPVVLVWNRLFLQLWFFTSYTWPDTVFTIIFCLSHSCPLNTDQSKKHLLSLFEDGGRQELQICLQVFIIIASRHFWNITPALISWFKSAGVPLLAIKLFYILNLVTEAALFYARGIFFLQLSVYSVSVLVCRCPVRGGLYFSSFTRLLIVKHVNNLYLNLFLTEPQPITQPSDLESSDQDVLQCLNYWS